MVGADSVRKKLGSPTKLGSVTATNNTITVPANISFTVDNVYLENIKIILVSSGGNFNSGTGGTFPNLFDISVNENVISVKMASLFSRDKVGTVIINATADVYLR